MTVRDRILLRRAGVSLHCEDALEVLRGMPAESVQCCITSPPYYGLRDYGTAAWEGGDPTCDHLKPGTKTGMASTLRNDGREHMGPYEGEAALTVGYPFGPTCGKCGAHRISIEIGHEPTPSAYIARLVEVFRGVRMVLKPDGVLFVVIGDSYASNWPCSRRNVIGAGSLENGRRENRPPRMGAGLKDKDLIGIPHMLAFALRDDGWYWRSEIVWAKPNPMPESVTDRCTRSHEFVMMFAKGGQYHHDSDAISEPITCYRLRGTAGYLHVPGGGDNSGLSRAYKSGKYYFDADAISEPISTDPRENYPARSKSATRGTQGGAAARGNDRDKSGGFPPKEGDRRNKRDVWWIPTKPTSWGKGLHFAAFPEALVEPMILAGSRPGDTVLDPFAGSGSTGAVAVRLSRKFVGIDLKPEYIAICHQRLLAEVPGRIHPQNHQKENHPAMELRYKCCCCDGVWPWKKLHDQHSIPLPPYGACPRCGDRCDLLPVLSAKASAAAAAAGMSKAETGTNEEWALAAVEEIYQTALEYDLLSTDEVMDVFVRDFGNFAAEGTRTLSALGPLMRDCAQLGWFAPTGTTRPSRRPENHCKPARIWHSLLRGGASQ